MDLDIDSDDVSYIDNITVDIFFDQINAKNIEKAKVIIEENNKRHIEELKTIDITKLPANNLVVANSKVASQWYYEKNGDLMPWECTAGSGKNVWWLCSVVCEIGGCLHIYKGTIASKLVQKFPCPLCCPAPRQFCYHVSLGYLYPKLSLQWNYNKNTDFDITPSKILPYYSKPVWWICENAICKCKHEWQATPHGRVKNNAGCPYCSTPASKFCIHSTIIHTHPEIAKEWHPTKNGELKPENISKGCHTKVWFICDQKHEYKASVYHRTSPTNKRGCPICVNKTEKKLYEMLNNIYDVQQGAKFEWCRNPENNYYLPFDFEIIGYKLLIELDGDQHFTDSIIFEKSSDENVFRDIYKMKQAVENGYSIIRLSQYHVYYDLIDWKNKLKSLIKVYNEPDVFYIDDNKNIYSKHIEEYQKYNRDIQLDNFANYKIINPSKRHERARNVKNNKIIKKDESSEDERPVKKVKDVKKTK